MNESMKVKGDWEYMQDYRQQLSVAEGRKEVRAKHGEQLRLAGDYMRSLRHWVGLADNNNETLKARKAALADSLATPPMLINRAAAINCCEWQLVNDSCQSNIRDAISWVNTALGARSLKDWQECIDSAEACIADAVVQLEVALAKMKALWKSAKSAVELARWCISKCAKAVLPPVALSKDAKLAIMKRNITVSNYSQRVPVARNMYNLVSAAACINQRAEGTVLNTKLWLRLVRTTRGNHVHRNAHNWNNRQDYLARLPV